MSIEFPWSSFCHAHVWCTVDRGAHSSKSVVLNVFPSCGSSALQKHWLHVDKWNLPIYKEIKPTLCPSIVLGVAVLHVLLQLIFNIHPNLFVVHIWANNGLQKWWRKATTFLDDESSSLVEWNLCEGVLGTLSSKFFSRACWLIPLAFFPNMQIKRGEPLPQYPLPQNCRS